MATPTKLRQLSQSSRGCDESLRFLKESGGAGVTRRGSGARKVVCGPIFGQRRRRQALAFLTAAREAPAFPELTLREREVLDLIASGLDNAAIASRLGLAVHTVGNHVL